MQKLNKLQMLISYPYYKLDKHRFDQLWTEHADTLDLLVDSGAFTAYKVGMPITLNEYMAFLRSLPCVPWNYMQLDVIGDYVQTWTNYQEMIDNGFYSTVPVFQRDAPIHMLWQLQPGPLVGIGGVAGTNGAQPVVKELMTRHIDPRHTHWLGFGSVDFVTVYRPYSFDVTNWFIPTSFGKCDIYLGAGKFVLCSRDNVDEFLRNNKGGIAERLELIYGLHPRHMQSTCKVWASYKGLRALAAAGYMEYMADLYKLFDTRLFMGCGNPCVLHTLICLDVWKTKGTNDFSPYIDCLIHGGIDYSKRYDRKSS